MNNTQNNKQEEPVSSVEHKAFFASPVIGVFAAFFSAVFFSSKAIFVKLAYVYTVDPITLLTLRMAIAFPFFLLIFIIFRFKKGAMPIPFKKGDGIRIVYLGFLGYYLASVFDFYALSYISAGLERMILFLYPTFTVALGLIILKKRLTKRVVFSVLLSYSGVVFLFISEKNLAGMDSTLIGGGMVLISALSYAVCLFLSSPFAARVGTIAYTSLVAGSSTIAVVLHFLVTHSVSDLIVPAPVYGYAFLMATLSTVLPFLLLGEALKRVGAEKSALIGTIGPVSTLLFAYFLLEEQIGIIKICGSALVLIGVLLITVKEKGIRR